MTTRWYGIALAALGGALGVLPFTQWYRADLPGREVTARGVAVSGELWTLPALAAVIACVGVVIAVRRPAADSLGARWLGGVGAVCGALGCAWALWSVFRITGVATPVRVSDGPEAPLRAQPAAWIAAAAGATVAAVSLWWVRTGRDRG